MKKGILTILVLICLLMTGCSEYFASQRTFQASDLQEISPVGLQYEASLGQNWWKGTFEGKEVIIHAVVTDQYVNVDFQFTPEN